MKRRFPVILVFLASLLVFFPINANSGNFLKLQEQLENFVDGKDATIGIAIITNDNDTISVNGDRPFPMLSVYKFPIAFALGEYSRQGYFSIPDSIIIRKDELKENTYSPMRECYGHLDSVKISFNELLAYSLQQSDNNASDIILNLLPSVDYVNQCLENCKVSGIKVSSSEEEMHEDISLCYSNTSTPLAMASFLTIFDNEYSDSYSMTIKQLMETCSTGRNRLVRPIPIKESDILVGHKTGTGFELADGRLMAINDVGYIHLPIGLNYSIAVFVENSGYDMKSTEDIIAGISEIVLKYMLSLK